MQLGRYDRAHAAFEQVLNRDPRNLTATISLAGLESNARRRKNALALLRHALVLAPGDQTATTELARRARSAWIRSRSHKTWSTMRRRASTRVSA